MMCAALAGSAFVSSCSDDDDEFGTEQFKGGISLNVWGPSPVARGGELRFIGSGLDNISSITLPGSGDITDIKVISQNEIRITVPQNAEPGYVVLHHANGDIKSRTELTFTEPISLDEITPATIKPGELLTIKGDYLNLIKEIIFAQDITVGEDDFTSHTRKEITLIVPDEAQSGDVIISDGDPDLPNMIYSESPITITLPAVEEVKDITKAKPGDNISVKGSDLDLVRKIVMPNEDEIEFEVKGDVISFTLPANASDGAICMVPGSGIKIAVATIGVAIPEETVADPGKDIWSGDVIKVKGINMELVTDVIFPGVEQAVEPTSKSATEITLTVPEGAQSGNLLLNTASGNSVEVAVMTLQPENIVYNPAPAALAGNLTVNGKNLQNVVAICFAGSTTVDVKNPEATSFSISVPATLQAGSNTVTLVLSNGENVEAPAIELTAPECAYATELPAEDAEINAGETFTLPIANGSLLTEVQVDGAKTQHILQGSNLIILVPDNVGMTAKVTLVSSNGSISYDMNFIPATHVENVIMNEVRDLGTWAGENDGGAFRLYKDAFKDVPAGAKLVFHVNSYKPAQIQLNDANWGSFETLKPDQSETLVAYELSADILNRILTTSDGWSETAMVIQGEGTVVSKVHIEWERSLETVIFAGEYQLAWGPHLMLEKELFNGIKPGAILRAYFKEEKSGYQMQLNHNNWVSFGSMAEWNEPKNLLTYELTADDVNGMLNPPSADTNYGLIIQGDGNTLVKLTWENQ